MGAEKEFCNDFDGLKNEFAMGSLPLGKFALVQCKSGEKREAISGETRHERIVIRAYGSGIKRKTRAGAS